MAKKRSVKRIFLIAAAVLAAVLAVLLLTLQVREVTVTGIGHYTQEEIEEILFPDRLSRNSLYCYLQNRLKEHEKIPFVEDYEIVFQSPGRVEVIIYEKSIVGYVTYMSSYMYFDKDGIIVESASTKLEGVPEITGLSFGQITLYQKLPVENASIFQEILNLTQILLINDLEADRIQYNSLGEATLYMGDIVVLLGGNKELNGKIAELGAMLPLLEGQSGTLHLENYDETNTAAGFSFEPDK